MKDIYKRNGGLFGLILFTGLLAFLFFGPLRDVVLWLRLLGVLFFIGVYCTPPAGKSEPSGGHQMRIEGKSFWIQLINSMSNRILFQCATDKLTEEEFLQLWNSTGRTVWREVNAQRSKDNYGAELEFRVRTTTLTGG